VRVVDRDAFLVFRNPKNLAVGRFPTFDDVSGMSIARALSNPEIKQQQRGLHENFEVGEGDFLKFSAPEGPISFARSRAARPVGGV
jgi:hypothetical protein